MNKLKVDLGQNSYPIFISIGILQNLGEMLKIYDFSHRTVVITDSNVNKYYGEVINKTLDGCLDAFELITIGTGERSKSLRTVERIMTRMLELGCDRKSAVLAFGGGVVGDIAGFAASIYKRGVSCIQIPTTLLAQVDSSIGGKTGVNHALGKNMIGTFHQPRLVWTDLSVLKTLPEREIVCGLAEIIKYGIIKDAMLFDLVEETFENILALDLELLKEIVTRCCEIKADTVEKDERESGLRMILNFGHTIGHALEAEMGYKKISHGEAVLLGMLAESKMALDLEMLSRDDFQRIEKLIARFKVTGKFKGVQSDSIIEFMRADKKASKGRLKFILPRKIGDVEVVEDVKTNSIKTGMKRILC